MIYHDLSTDILVSCPPWTRPGCNFVNTSNFVLLCEQTTFLIRLDTPSRKISFFIMESAIKCENNCCQSITKYCWREGLSTDFTQWLISRQNISFFAEIFWWLLVLRVISACSPWLEWQDLTWKENYRIIKSGTHTKLIMLLLSVLQIICINCQHLSLSIVSVLIFEFYNGE